VSRYVLRLYGYLEPRVVKELLQALSKVYVKFDSWTTQGGKHGFLGIVVHYIDSRGNLQDLPIALPQLTGAHSGERIAEVILETLDLFSIDAHTLGYFALDNASNNNSAVLAIAQKMGFSATNCCLRCSPHTLNLIGQRLLWGQDTDVYNNNAREFTDESKFMCE
jgi:hypothetical protein